MLPFFFMGTLLTLVGLGAILFRTKFGNYYASYYQRTETWQRPFQTTVVLVVGGFLLALGYYRAYFGYPQSIFFITGGILLVLFCKQIAARTVASSASQKDQSRAILMVGCASTGIGLLFLLQGIMLPR